MISYELAKKLKDAGFILSKKRIMLGMNQKIYKKSDNEILSADFEYAPTLSELIEACGDRFDILRKEYDGYWVAESEPSDSFGADYSGEGSTSEVAVALLWLELNKK